MTVLRLSRRPDARIIIGEKSWPVPSDLAGAVSLQATDLKTQVTRLKGDVAVARGEAAALARLLDEMGRARDAERDRADEVERRLAAVLEAQEQERRDAIAKLAPASLRAEYTAKNGADLRNSLAAVVDAVSAERDAAAAAEQWIAQHLNYFKPGTA